MRGFVPTRPKSQTNKYILDFKLFFFFYFYLFILTPSISTALSSLTSISIPVTVKGEDSKEFLQTR